MCTTASEQNVCVCMLVCGFGFNGLYFWDFIGMRKQTKQNKKRIINTIDNLFFTENNHFTLCSVLTLREIFVILDNVSHDPFCIVPLQCCAHDVLAYVSMLKPILQRNHTWKITHLSANLLLILITVIHMKNLLCFNLQL